MRNLFRKTNGWTKETPTEDGLYAYRSLSVNNKYVMTVEIKNGYFFPCEENATSSTLNVYDGSLKKYNNSCEWFKIEESKTFNVKLTWFDFWFGGFLFGYFLIAYYGSCNVPT
jgi:hypothetical protein